MSNIQPQTRVRTRRSHAAPATTQVSSTSVSHSSIHIQLPHPVALQGNFHAATLNSEEENLCKLWLQQVPRLEIHHPAHIPYETRAFLLDLGLDPRPLSNEQVHQLILGIHVHHKALCALNKNITNAEAALPISGENFHANSKLSNAKIPRLPTSGHFSCANSELHNSSNTKIPRLPNSGNSSCANPKFQNSSNAEIPRLPISEKIFMHQLRNSSSFQPRNSTTSSSTPPTSWNKFYIFMALECSLQPAPWIL